jgi:colicin import membrane protein
VQTAEAGCRFPTGPGEQTCGRPIERSGARGRPSSYCDLPEHTRAKAFAARRTFPPTSSDDGRAEGEAGEQPVEDEQPPFAGLLAQFADIAEQTRLALDDQQRELAAILEQAVEVARTATDPDAVVHEVDRARHDAGEQRRLAEQAAAGERAVRAELERVRAEGAGQVAAAEQAADTARRDAATQVLTAQQQVAEAADARTRAEAKQAAAERRAIEDRAVAEQLRVELDRARTDHRAELATLRREAAAERAALRREAAEHLALVLADRDPR